MVETEMIFRDYGVGIEIHPEATQDDIDRWSAETGMEWDGGKITPKVVPVTVITIRQGLQQLEAMGLLARVEELMAVMPRTAQIDFERATTIESNHWLVVGFVKLFGWSEVEKNDYFLAASKL